MGGGAFMVTGKVGKVLPGLAAGPASGNLQNICTVCKKYPLVCEFIITNKQNEYLHTARIGLFVQS